MRLRKAVETLWEISRLEMRYATGKTTRGGLMRLAKPGFRLLPGAEDHKFLAHGSLHMAVKNHRARFGIGSTDSGSCVHLPVRIESEVLPNQGGFEWPFRHISLNWNGNTRASKTNYTKRSSTFQRTTCK